MSLKSLSPSLSPRLVKLNQLQLVCCKYMGSLVSVQMQLHVRLLDTLGIHYPICDLNIAGQIRTDPPNNFASNDTVCIEHDLFVFPLLNSCV